MEKQTVRPAHIRRRHILARLLLSAAAVVILLPVVLTALYSFFSPGEIKAFMQTRGSFDAKSLMEIKLSPNMFSLSQYYKILIEDMTILRYFVNSAMYTAAILFGQALLIPAMAYALSRFRFRGRDALFFVVIMLMLLPFQVTMVPNVITLRAMGLLDTIWAIILPMTVAPFYIFLLRQYMVGLPGDMIEAAQIDGAGTLRCFIHVVLPVCQPILGATMPIRWAVLFVGVALLLSLLARLNAAAWGRVCLYADRLKTRYARDMLAGMIASALLMLLGYAALAGAAFALAKFSIDPLYVFTEWVPEVLVELSSIAKRFWSLNDANAAAVRYVSRSCCVLETGRALLRWGLLALLLGAWMNGLPFFSRRVKMPEINRER